jgi:hypothetical protein
MNIYFDQDVPDSTYFRVGDCEPYFSDGDLYLYDGRGSYRSSWGSPQVSSSVIFNNNSVIAIHIGFSHKHGGGQFWRYYDNEGNKLSWGKLDDDTRQLILNSDRPSWARIPGKLRKNYNLKPKKWVGYKIVGIDDNGSLFSLYDNEFEYELNKTKIQAAREDHGGGFYVHKSIDSLLSLWNNGKLVNENRVVDNIVLVECECWGNEIKYDNGKVSVSYCKPLAILDV